MAEPLKHCSVEGCSNKYWQAGYCCAHYTRMRRHGHTNETRRLRGQGNITPLGYVEIVRNGIRKGQHVWAAEKALGKKLPPGAEVHHVDGNPSNNSPTNLVVCPDRSYHWLIERRTRAFNACGHADYVRCSYCKEYDAEENMVMNKNGKYGHHRKCEREYQRKRKVLKLSVGA